MRERFEGIQESIEQFCAIFFIFAVEGKHTIAIAIENVKIKDHREQHSKSNLCLHDQSILKVVCRFQFLANTGCAMLQMCCEHASMALSRRSHWVCLSNALLWL